MGLGSFVALDALARVSWCPRCTASNASTLTLACVAVTMRVVVIATW
jgi:hypothetical protein